MQDLERMPEVDLSLVTELTTAFIADRGLPKSAYDDYLVGFNKMLLSVVKRFHQSCYNLLSEPEKTTADSLATGIHPVAMAIRKTAGVNIEHIAAKSALNPEKTLRCKTPEWEIVRTNTLLVMCDLLAQEEKHDPLFVSRARFTHDRVTRHNVLTLPTRGDITDRRRAQLNKCSNRFGFNSAELLGPRVAEIVERRTTQCVGSWHISKAFGL